MANALTSLMRGMAAMSTKAAVPSMNVVNSASLVREPYAGAWQRGVSVDPIGSLTNFGAVFACVSTISQDVAKLTPRLMARRADGTWQVDDAVSQPARVLRRPNRYQTWLQFAEHWLAAKLLHGNVYVLKERDNRSQLAGLHLLDPRRVTPLVTEVGDVYYRLQQDLLAGVTGSPAVPAAQIIHDRGPTLWHPLVGVSPIVACGLAATQGLRIQANSAKFFENMSRPGGVLVIPGDISDTAFEKMKAEWNDAASLGKTAVLTNGMKYEPTSMPADVAQLIEQLKWTVEDVARAFRVPLHKIGAGTAPSLAGIEAQEASYYAGCLQSHIEAMEACLDAGFDLGVDRRVEFDLAGLLRTDMATRYEALGKGVTGGWLAPDEARASENLPPVPGGKYPLAQQQNYSLEALAKRDALPNPFAPADTTPAASKEADYVRQIAELSECIGRADEMLARPVSEDRRRELENHKSQLHVSRILVLKSLGHGADE